MKPADDAHQRLIALEERLTFQQRLIDDLNEALLDHRRETLRLAQELERCRLAMEHLREAALGENLPHEKPPHY